MARSSHPAECAVCRPPATQWWRMCPMLTDAEITRLTPAQRRRLIRKLTKSLEEVAGPRARVERIRRLRMTFVIGAVLVLIPWIVYLGFTLPNRHVTTHW